MFRRLTADKHAVFAAKRQHAALVLVEIPQHAAEQTLLKLHELHVHEAGECAACLCSNGVLSSRARATHLAAHSVTHSKVAVYATTQLKLAHLRVLGCAANLDLDDLVFLDAANCNDVTIRRISQLVNHRGLKAVYERKRLAALRSVVVSASLVV